MSATCRLWTERLSCLLDRTLGPVDQAAVEAHLASCASCRSVLAELRAVVERAQALENPAPAVDLWPGILERIRPSEPVAPAPKFWSRRFALSVPQAAAAAFGLILVVGTLAWLTFQTEPERPRPGPESAARRPQSPPSSARSEVGPSRSGIVADRPDAVLAAFSDPRYDAAIADLRSTLARGRGRLDTSTVRVMEQNLALIDRALEEARRAVARDPSNTYLRSHLASTMRRKADLLKRASTIPGSQG